MSVWLLVAYDWDGKALERKRFSDRKKAERAADRIATRSDVQSVYVNEKKNEEPLRGNGRYR